MLHKRIYGRLTELATQHASLQKQLMNSYSTSPLTPTSPFQRREEKHTSGQVGQNLVLTVTAKTKHYNFSHQLKKKFSDGDKQCIIKNDLC